jgi:hypothetical protein
MKKTMPNGEIIEGTPAELAEYERAFNATNNTAPAPEREIAPEPPREIAPATTPKTDAPKRETNQVVVTRKPGQSWLPHEDAIIEEMYRTHWSNQQLRRHALPLITKMLPGRTDKSIIGRAATIRIADRIMAEKNQGKTTTPPPKPKNNGAAQKEALNQALLQLQEDHKPKPKPIVDEEEIYMVTLGPQDQEPFRDIAKDMIANQTVCRFPTHGKMLRIDHGWDWVAFIEEFTRKKDKIAAYFGAKDYFQFRKEKDKFHAMAYTRPPRPTLL